MLSSGATKANPVDYETTAPHTTTEWNDLRDVPEHIGVRDRVGTKWTFDEQHGWRFKRDGVVYSPTYLSPNFWTWLGPFVATS